MLDRRSGKCVREYRLALHRNNDNANVPTLIGDEAKPGAIASRIEVYGLREKSLRTEISNYAAEGAEARPFDKSVIAAICSASPATIT